MFSSIYSFLEKYTALAQSLSCNSACFNSINTHLVFMFLSAIDVLLSCRPPLTPPSPHHTHTGARRKRWVAFAAEMLEALITAEFGILLNSGKNPTNSKATSQHDLNSIDLDTKRQSIKYTIISKQGHPTVKTSWIRFWDFVLIDGRKYC